MPDVQFTGSFPLHAGRAIDSDARVAAILEDYRALLAVAMPDDLPWLRTLDDLAFCYIAGLQEAIDALKTTITEFRTHALGKKIGGEYSATHDLFMSRDKWRAIDRKFAFDRTTSREPIDKLIGAKRGRRPISFQKALEICAGLEVFARDHAKWPKPELIYAMVTVVPVAFVLEGLKRADLTDRVLETFSTLSGQPLAHSALVLNYEGEKEWLLYEQNPKIREVLRSPEALAFYKPATLRSVALLRSILREEYPDRPALKIVQIPSGRIALPKKVDKYEELDLRLYLGRRLDLGGEPDLGAGHGGGGGPTGDPDVGGGRAIVQVASPDAPRE